MLVPRCGVIETTPQKPQEFLGLEPSPIFDISGDIERERDFCGIMGFLHGSGEGEGICKAKEREYIT